MAKQNKKVPFGKYIAAAAYVAVAISLAEKMKQPKEDIVLATSQETILLPNPQTKLSDHDEHIEKISYDHQVDWRLTAALISVESSFNDKAKSKSGAIGLMQVMPVVYRELKTPMGYQPETNIRVGLTHFKKLHAQIEAQSERDHLLMTFAAYNAGLGHLRDAQRLALGKGLDPFSWDDLRKVYPLLEKATYHQHTSYGYCHGRGIVNYAEKVMAKYGMFQKIYSVNRNLQFSKNIYFSGSESYRS